MKMLGQDWIILAIGILAIIMLLYTTNRAEATPVKGVVLSEYKVGRTTIYEWQTHHNRLCTMVVDRIQSNAPFISCN